MAAKKKTYVIKTLNDFLNVPYKHLDEMCANLREGIEAMKRLNKACEEMARCDGEDPNLSRLQLTVFELQPDGKRHVNINLKDTEE